MSNEGFACYICDTETTSLDTVEGDVIEVSFCRLIPREDGKYDEEQKTWLLRALNPKAISDEALAINKHAREDILCISKFGKENYKNPTDVLIEIEEWIASDNVSAMDRVFVGQNPMFDVNALKELYRKCKIKFPFELSNGNRILDTKQIAVLFDLCTGRRRKYYNLSSLVKAAGVKKGRAHKADEDTRMTKDLLLVFMNIIKDVVAERFKDCYPDDEEA